jgi:hypothetical protein
MSPPVSHLMLPHYRIARIVALAVATLTVGCGGSDLDRIPVAGRVTFNGEAVAKGQIRFIPQSGTKGPVTVEPINEGQYATDKTGGVPIGSHRVEIRGYDAHEYATAPTGPGSPPIKQLLPAKYNTASELSATLDPNSDHELNFELAP